MTQLTRIIDYFADKADGHNPETRLLQAAIEVQAHIQSVKDVSNDPKMDTGYLLALINGDGH